MLYSNFCIEDIMHAFVKDIRVFVKIMRLEDVSIWDFEGFYLLLYLDCRKQSCIFEGNIVIGIVNDSVA